MLPPIDDQPAPSGEVAADLLPLTSIGFRKPVELCVVDLPEEEAIPLLERGLLPGCTVELVRNSPSGDPVIRVEGSVLALRRETARHLMVRDQA